MTLTGWMLYSVAITVLLASAAWLLELGVDVDGAVRLGCEAEREHEGIILRARPRGRG